MLNKAIVIHSDMRAGIRMLSTAQAGELFLAACAWADGAEVVINDAALVPFWGMMRCKLEEYADRYTQKCKKLSENRLGKTTKDINSKQMKSIDDISAETKTKTKTKTKYYRVVVPGAGPGKNEEGQVDVSRISFDAVTGKITGAGSALEEVWRRTYPAVDVDRQVALAGVWLMENPRRLKKDLRRFVGNWLRSAQRDAEARGPARRTAEDGRAAEVRVHEGGLLV